MASVTEREKQHEQALRTFSIELLAWLVWDGVNCTLPDRHVEDYLLAERYFNEHPEIFTELLRSTSPGIHREAFNDRFLKNHYISFMSIVQNRERWMKEFYTTLTHEIDGL